MQNFSEKQQNIFHPNGPVGSGLRRNMTLIRARVLELGAGVIGAGRMESLIGNGIPGSKLDKNHFEGQPPKCYAKLTEICAPVPRHV